MLFKKLFQKNKKNDIERYKGEKEKADKGQALLIMEELINKVPDNVVYTKQTEAGTYVFANYWNDGTLFMYNPEGDDGEYLSRKIKFVYNLNYHRQEMINALHIKMQVLKKKEDIRYMLSELEELSSYIIDLSNKEEYAIYREMGQTRKFMDTYLEMYKTAGVGIEDVNLFFRCVEANLYEGNIEYAVKQMEYFLEQFRSDRYKWEEFAQNWFWIYLCVDDKEKYIKHYTEFKKWLEEDGFGEFVNDLEKEESWNVEKDFEEKQKKGKMDAIVETLKKSPALAMEQWITLVQEKEKNKEIGEWQWYLFYYFSATLFCEFGDFRGFVLLAREFMKHEEWFHFLVYAREDAYDVGDNLVKLRINRKYEQQIDKIVKILHSEWNKEEWGEFKEGYTNLTYDACTIEKETLDQFVTEETYLERHRKHFQEMFLED